MSGIDCALAWTACLPFACMRIYGFSSKRLQFLGFDVDTEVEKLDLMSSFTVNVERRIKTLTHRYAQLKRIRAYKSTGQQTIPAHFAVLYTSDCPRFAVMLVMLFMSMSLLELAAHGDKLLKKF